jgi:membrane-associated phospholipid phosphatase
VAGAIASSADAAYPSSSTPPNLIPLLSGYNLYWQSDGLNDLHGTVLDAKVLEHNDKLTVWINNHATPAQQFNALQTNEYNDGPGEYDESETQATALGSILGPIYVQGINSGALPLTTALLNDENGSAGAYVSTGAAKANYSYPRPFLPVNANATPVPGDAAGCAPSIINGSSLKAIRLGRSYADANGDLNIVRVPVTTDTTHEFSAGTPTLDPSYGATGICTGGSFPSGHTTNAYESGIMLATLLPQLAPEILARTSEQGNNRIVLGVHYPLDIMGGRIDGEAAESARWSDPQFVTGAIDPAQQELVSYLQAQCGGTVLACYKQGTPYTDNPYDGASLPGGTSEIVTNRKTALKVYEERLTYGFPQSGTTGLAPSVPTGAENLLETAFPGLDDAQRVAVLAQTEIASGYPLDGTGTSTGAWERLDLAAALSATVYVASDGTATVESVGGQPTEVGPGAGPYGETLSGARTHAQATSVRWAS